jgi:hypothetical protein
VKKERYIMFDYVDVDTKIYYIKWSAFAGVSRPAFLKQVGWRSYLICIVATMLQQNKLSICGSHLTSKMREEKPLSFCSFE